MTNLICELFQWQKKKKKERKKKKKKRKLVIKRFFLKSISLSSIKIEELPMAAA